jgi:hypothetical protein
MQLSGPPKLNGWEAPLPSKQTPLDAAFRRDEDVETYVKYRDGTLQRVGPRHYRLRARFEWAALTYDLAHAILSAVSEHPVGVYPRTKESGDPSYLTEHAYDCRLVGELPIATPLYRRDGQGNRLARVAIEVESLSTVTELPDSITGGVDQVTA